MGESEDDPRVSARLRIVNRKVNPLLGDLPEKFSEFRTHQIRAVSQVVDALDRVDLVFLDAPTGSGKTVIGEAVRRLMRTAAIYICSTKSLQDQFIEDFPYANVLKGRRNYPTESFPSSFHPGEFAGHVSCEDCTWTKQTGKCKWCTSKGKCPYEVAKNRALSGNLAVLNTSYFLAEVNNIGRFANWPLVIADEADTLESNLMGHVSVEISNRRMEKYGIGPVKKVTVPESWMEWLDEVLPVVKKEYDRLPEFTEDIRVVREAKYLSDLYSKLSFVKAGIEDGYWVYTGKDEKGASFQPSRVDSLGQEYLWKHGEKWLLMSASLVSPEEVAESLGYQGSYEVVKVPSTFPIENRKVVFAPAADMARKHKETAWPQVAERLVRIVNDHRDSNVLVHTVSYELTGYLQESLRAGVRIAGYDRPVLTYRSAADRESTLSEFKREGNAVLLAPSMDRGIDLPGELCRVQVIVKCPFPFLDRVTSARLHSKGGQLWYTVQTVRSIVQMCGRAVRSKEDFAVTYILDKQFESMVWSRGRSLFPSWFSEAIDWRSGR